MADAANAPSFTTPQTGQTNYKKIAWTLNGVSTGVPVKVADYADKTFQAHDVNGGSTWGGATLVLEGSMDATADPAHADYATSTWKTLTDTTETALSFTADTDVVTVLQNPLWIRPRTSAGTTTTIYASLGVKK